MKFLAWLKEQVGRDDPVGDLANDFISDDHAPSVRISADEFRRYMVDRQASRGAMDAFDAALAEFKKENQ